MHREDNGCPGESREGHRSSHSGGAVVGVREKTLGLGYLKFSTQLCASHPPQAVGSLWCLCVTFLRQWFSWERLGSPGESEMSQEPSALRVCVNCFLPGALGREPRRLSQHLEQYKQMLSASSTWKRKMSCLASLNSQAGCGGDMAQNVK